MKLSDAAPLLLYILILGCVTSLEDIRSGKIKNHWILSAMAFTSCFYFLNFMTSYVQYVALARDIVRDIFVNAGLALLTGIMLWKAGIWPPGDAKLFFAYALLIPLSYYSNGYLPYFPSLALLVNIFVAGFAYVAFATVRTELKIRALALWIEKYFFKKKYKEVIKAANMRSASGALLQKFLTVMALMILAVPLREKIFYFFPAPYAMLPAVVFLFAYGHAQKFLLKIFSWRLLSFFVVCYAVSGLTAGGGAFLHTFFSLLRLSFIFMFLGEGAGELFKFYMKYLEKEEKESPSQRGILSDYIASESGSRSAGIAFAPVMFCGVLTTLVMKQSIVHFILQWLRGR